MTEDPGLAPDARSPAAPGAPAPASAPASVPAGVSAAGDDARGRLVVALAFVLVVVSLPAGAWGARAAAGGLVLAAAAAARTPPRAVALRLLVLAPVLLALLAGAPWVPSDGPRVALGPVSVAAPVLERTAAAGAAAALCVLAVTALTTSTPFPALVEAAGRLRAPRLLVALLGFTHRAGGLLAEEAARMRRARDARLWRARALPQARDVGWLVAALFLRAHARGERVHRAMLARGLAGRPPAAAPAPWPLRSGLATLAALLALLALRVAA